MTVTLALSRIAALDRRLRQIEANPASAAASGPGGGVAGFAIDDDGHLQVGYAGAAPDIIVSAEGRLLLEV